MADLSITAANVVKGSGASVKHGIAAEALTAGQAIHKLASDGDLYLSDADHATAAKRACSGIALHDAAIGQPIAYQDDGQIDIGATVVVGTVYCLSDTAGGICPVADLASGDYVTIIGVGVTATDLGLSLYESEVAVP